MGPKDTFLASLARCREEADFIPGFYRRFIASSPAVNVKFLFTDFQRQERMLLRSLELAAAATEGDPDGLAELTARAETHSRAQLDVRPELYGLWLDSVVESARACDSAWSADVESAWRIILGFVIGHMTRRYATGG